MIDNLPSKYRILHEIWLNPKQSRVELSKKLNLDKSTISLITNKFLKDGVIVETDSEKNHNQSVGRSPIMLSTNGNFGYVLGISIEHHSYQVLVIDFFGKILFSEETEEIINKKNLKATIEMLYWKYLEKLKNLPGIFLGIGIGIGGLINHENGTIVYSVALEIYKPFKLLEELENDIPIPVSIENDSNCCAMTELVFRESNQTTPDNLLFLFIEIKHSKYSDLGHGHVGIGIGFIINGKIYYGNNSFAGEFKSIFCNNSDHYKQVSEEDFNLDALKNNPLILKKVIKEISQNLAFLVNTLDITEIVIGGDIESIDSSICEEIKNSIHENWFYPVERQINVRYSSYGTKTVSYGAASKLERVLFQTQQLPI